MSWTNNTTNQDGYRIYRSEDGTNFTEIGTQAFEMYIDTTVSQGTLYYYRVTAYNATDESNPSNTVTVTPDDYYVNILTPNTGPTLTIGSMYDITWDTNMPGFDAVIKLSITGGSPFPYDIQMSWYPNTSPYAWKVGYQNLEDNPQNPPNWQQIIASMENQCLIYIEDYVDPSVNDTCDVVFTVTP